MPNSAVVGTRLFSSLLASIHFKQYLFELDHPYGQGPFLGIAVFELAFEAKQ